MDNQTDEVTPDSCKTCLILIVLGHQLLGSNPGSMMADSMRELTLAAQFRMRWGRWSLDGNHLVYHPDAGEPDPEYDIEVSALCSRSAVRDRIEHLRSKRWVRPEDLHAVEQAGTDLMNFLLVDESDMEAPPPMPWDDYREQAAAAWLDFLRSADPTNERAFHAFFETYPVLLPGAYGAVRRWQFGVTGSEHGPLPGGVISEPELPGCRPKRPDFLLFEQDSASVYAVLIEIEAPSKSWCNSDGTPNARFTQAHDQLRDWDAWFSEPANVIAFQNLYGVSSDILRGRRLIPHYVLIYGRRAEATKFDAFAKKRIAMARPDEFLMTYDRLVAGTGNALTLRLDRSGPDTAFRVVSIPPTFAIERDNAVRFSRMIGREDAIRSCALISEERRAFLLERIQVADSYARRAP
ncbi:Shedu anti-phage system protein SduA domain-containing protein [Sorangium sp. So ce861]|uniref:Shedu anti-phage system protein SduA domain-containing protein n=1 Tax=Sorangium sp. So ce861 TaxID=3133323 RepID=UPI003F608AE6